MTGGAFGSLIAQFLNLTSAERRTPPVAGAAAGMSATSASPDRRGAAAVELLLFEWKPRSYGAGGAGQRRRRHRPALSIGLGPLFPVSPHAAFSEPWRMAGMCADGSACAALSSALLDLGRSMPRKSF